MVATAAGFFAARPKKMGRVLAQGVAAGVALGPLCGPLGRWRFLASLPKFSASLPSCAACGFRAMMRRMHPLQHPHQHPQPAALARRVGFENPSLTGLTPGPHALSFASDVAPKEDF
jgi:hypothetical protein